MHMDASKLKTDLAAINSLIDSGAVTKERGEEWKKSILDKFEKENFPKDATMPNDLAHVPGRLVGSVIGALKQINPERCAGVDRRDTRYGDRENGRPPSHRKPMHDDPPSGELPEIYRNPSNNPFGELPEIYRPRSPKR